MVKRIVHLQALPKGQLPASLVEHSVNDVVERARGLAALLGERDGGAVSGRLLVGPPHLDEAVLGKVRHGARHRRAAYVNHAGEL